MAVANAGRYTKTVRVPLSAAADTAGAILAWANPEGVAIIAEILVDVTTATSGACTADFGVAADATTLNDTLIDGVSLNATGVKNGVKNAGTNGVMYVRVGPTQYITGSTASGAVAGLVGNAYIRYIKV